MNYLAKIASSLRGQKLKKPVFLGSIAVVPRKELKRIFEFGWEDHKTDQFLKKLDFRIGGFTSSQRYR
jgi:hypothetical protein